MPPSDRRSRMRCASIVVASCFVILAMTCFVTDVGFRDAPEVKAADATPGAMSSDDNSTHTTVVEEVQRQIQVPYGGFESDETDDVVKRLNEVAFERITVRHRRRKHKYVLPPQLQATDFLASPVALSEKDCVSPRIIVRRNSGLLSLDRADWIPGGFASLDALAQPWDEAALRGSIPFQSLRSCGVETLANDLKSGPAIANAKNTSVPPDNSTGLNHSIHRQLDMDRVVGAVVEVGCNDACESRSMGDRARRMFVGVEPLPRVALFNLHHGGLDIAWQAVVGPNGSAAMELPAEGVMTSVTHVKPRLVPNSTLSSTNAKTARWQLLDHPAVIVAPMVTLDSLLAASVPAHVPVQILIVDAQGYDLSVVLSASPDQLSRVDNIVLECQHVAADDVRKLYPGAPNCSTIAEALAEWKFKLVHCFANWAPLEYNCHFENASPARSIVTGNVSGSESRRRYQLTSTDTRAVVCTGSYCRGRLTHFRDRPRNVERSHTGFLPLCMKWAEQAMENWFQCNNREARLERARALSGLKASETVVGVLWQSPRCSAPSKQYVRLRSRCHVLAEFKSDLPINVEMSAASVADVMATEHQDSDEARQRVTKLRKEWGL